MRKLMLVATLSLASLAICPSAQAMDSRVCTGPKQPSDAPATKVLSNTVVFDCGDSVKGTIPELGKRSYRIVAFSLQSETMQTTVTQLIVQQTN
jgi:hypothetical protein